MPSSTTTALLSAATSLCGATTSSTRSVAPFLRSPRRRPEPARCAAPECALTPSRDRPLPLAQLGTGRRSNLPTPQHLAPLPYPGPAPTAIAAAPEAPVSPEGSLSSGTTSPMPHKRMQRASSSLLCPPLVVRARQADQGPPRRSQSRPRSRRRASRTPSCRAGPSSRRRSSQATAARACSGGS